MGVEIVMVVGWCSFSDDSASDYAARGPVLLDGLVR